MKVGIMGGTFDPIHFGHLLAAERAREECELDEVWFMPSNAPPHKVNVSGAGVRERWEMVCKALEDQPSFRAFDLELKRGGISYTVDTVKELNRSYPDHQFAYIIGADMVQFLPQWYKIDEIVELISFIGLQRPGFPATLESLPQHIRSKVRMAHMPLIEISSTEIRNRRKSNKSIRYLIPDAVLEFIEENDLYES